MKSKDPVEAVKAATATPKAEPALKLPSIMELRELKLDDLVKRVKKEARALASAHLTTGKILFILDEQRPKDKGGTLAKYARKELGLEIDSHAYKCANVFRIVGEGHGSITEAEFDACKLRWLIVTSQILNILDGDDYQGGAESVRQVREETAKVLRARTGDTEKLLQAIVAAIKPEKKQDDGDGAGDGDDAGDEKAAEDYLSRDFFKKQFAQLEKVEDPEALKLALAAFSNFVDFCQGMLDEKAPAAPVEVPAAA